METTEGYLFKKIATLSNGNTRWECNDSLGKNACRAEVILDKSDRVIKQIRGHNHKTNPEKVLFVKAKEEIVEQRKVVDPVHQGIERKRSVTFKQSKNQSAHPIVPHINDKFFSIPPYYTVNAVGAKFLVYDNAKRNRMLIFGTQESLNYLSKADDWYLDGTFKHTPLQFSQLVTIHGLKDGHNIVGAYAMLADKRTVVYNEMLTEIQRLTNHATPFSISMDFEYNMACAASEVYGTSLQRGGLFHLMLHVFTSVKELGLQETYMNDEVFRNNIRMIPAISFVAMGDTVRAFSKLFRHCGELEKPVLEHFETTFVGRMYQGRFEEPHFPYSMWNMNNFLRNESLHVDYRLEVWRSHFFSVLRHGNSSIWDFIELLKQNSSQNHINMAKLMTSSAHPSQVYARSDIMSSMRKLVQGYHISHLIPFLRGISSNLIGQYGDPLLLHPVQGQETKDSKTMDFWSTLSACYQPLKLF